METLLIILIVLAILNIILVVVLKAKPNTQNQELILKLETLDKTLQKIEYGLKDDFRFKIETSYNYDGKYLVINNNEGKKLTYEFYEN